MHDNNVAHRYVLVSHTFTYLIWPSIRDCTSGNIMLDPSNMYPESFHPVDIRRSKDFRRKAKWYTRTRCPTKYVLIDFGLSRRYDPANGPPLDKPYRGGDKSAPEHQDRVTPCNPFPTDVYYLGNLIRERYMQVRKFPFSSGHPVPTDASRNARVSNSWKHS
jgi:serine/threonine protein kinase